MTEKQRKALILLCPGHVFKSKKISDSPNPRFVKCENCPLEHGEVVADSKEYGRDVEVRYE